MRKWYSIIYSGANGIKATYNLLDKEVFQFSGYKEVTDYRGLSRNDIQKIELIMDFMDGASPGDILVTADNTAIVCTIQEEE